MAESLQLSMENVVVAHNSLSMKNVGIPLVLSRIRMNKGGVSLFFQQLHKKLKHFLFLVTRLNRCVLLRWSKAAKYPPEKGNFRSEETDTVPSYCVKDKLENLPALEGVGARLSTHADMQVVTAPCAVLPDGSATDLLNGTSVDASALREGDETCSLTGHLVGASDLQATVDVR
ncbi:hypothetical protein Nepgr_029980 [Nepenthes gracilis]|uniref:Uncharacterized protein n=1 Tax=Nepenthes gracilis TaxID=150966 RepID=A0AAD3Y3I5_NEPGR|nr:hypothetical protein Nepgr_029980 [Nepenthes gracilis]